MFKEKIIFMGTPKIASDYLNCLLKNKFNIVASFTQPPRKKGRGMKLEKSFIHKLSLDFQIPVFHPKTLVEEEIVNLIINLKPDLIVVMGYGLLIPENILKIPKYGCINIHVSLLPRWRGAAPIEFAILSGDKKTGVTIFKMDSGLDTGPILAAKEYVISNDINKLELSLKLNEIGTELLLNTLPKIFEYKKISRDQNNNESTYSKKISADITKIDFNKDINDVYNQIRAFAPKPASWFSLKNERIKIIHCKMERCKCTPSTIINDNFHIGCKNGKIIPLILQRQGKKVLSINEFLRGYKFSVSQRIDE